KSTYLDLETGEVLWIYEEDDDAELESGIEPEENAALREKINTSPERYLLIPGRDHGEHHDILREFLKSDWTDDEELRLRAQDAYTGSIGRWMEAVDAQEAVHAYFGFREHKIKELAEEFFKEQDIQPVWR
ncbi:MAG: hypothetical protein ACYTFM_13030, partial [Planctomycetota bacterium]